MPESSGRIETTHIDEGGRSATSSLQWLLENRNLKGKATHPITHNNKLTLFICGQEGFADIAGEIARSEEHTSELQSHHDLVCRLLLEKKKNKQSNYKSPKKKKNHNTPINKQNNT